MQIVSQTMFDVIYIILANVESRNIGSYKGKFMLSGGSYDLRALTTPPATSQWEESYISFSIFTIVLFVTHNFDNSKPSAVLFAEK